MNAPLATAPTKRRPLILAAVLCGTVVSAIEMTIVGTAMPRIVGTLGGSDRFAWVISIYLLTSTIAAPLSGKLADLYGRKPIYQLAMALFLVGSVASGAAPSMDALIVARALQGIGGGGLATVALTITGDIYTPVERGRIQGLFSALWGTAGAVGPLVGGLIVDGIGWRWIFYLNLPFGVAAMALLAFALHERVERRPVSLDIAGAITLAGAIAFIQLAGGGHGSHGGASRLPALAGVALLAAFAWIESRAASPILPLALLRNRLIATAFVATLLAGGVMFGVITYLPLFLQGVAGRSAGAAGAVMTPLTVAWPVMGVLAGFAIARIDPRILVRTGMTLVAVGSLLPLFARAGGSDGWFLVAGLVVGAGMGLSSTPLIIVLQAAVGWELRGIVTAGFSFCRTVGGTLGVILVGAIYGMRLEARGVNGRTVDAILRPGAHAAVGPVRDALAFALHGGFIALAVLGGSCVLAAAAFPPAPVHGQRNPDVHGAPAAEP